MAAHVTALTARALSLRRAGADGWRAAFHVYWRFTGDALAQMRCCLSRTRAFHRLCTSTQCGHVPRVLPRYTGARIRYKWVDCLGFCSSFVYSLPQNVRRVLTEIPARDTSRKKVWKSTCKANSIVYNS